MSLHGPVCSLRRVSDEADHSEGQSCEKEVRGVSVHREIHHLASLASLSCGMGYRRIPKALSISYHATLEEARERAGRKCGSW